MAPPRVGKALITLDTSALVTLLDRRDPEHSRVREEFLHDGGPYFVPAWIMAEVSYFAETRLGAKVVEVLLNDIAKGAFSLECGDGDVPRIRALVERYADLPLGVADASVIACAERNGGRVLTLDVRDFGVVAKEGTIQIVPS